MSAVLWAYGMSIALYKWWCGFTSTMSCLTWWTEKQLMTLILKLTTKNLQHLRYKLNVLCYVIIGYCCAINNDVHLANCFSDGTEEWKLFCDLQCNNRFGSCLGLMSTFKHKDFWKRVLCVHPYSDDVAIIWQRCRATNVTWQFLLDCIVFVAAHI